MKLQRWDIQRLIRALDVASQSEGWFLNPLLKNPHAARKRDIVLWRVLRCDLESFLNSTKRHYKKE